MAESVGGGKWEKYTDNEPIDLERSATEITVEKRVDESGRMEVRAIFPPGPTPLYFGPPFTFDSSGFFFFFLSIQFFFLMSWTKFFIQSFLFSSSLFIFFFRLSWSFKMDKNVCWMCGLVPIGKKDYRGPLSHDKLICLEEEKEASLMTPSYKTRRERDRNACNEKEMDLHQKEIEVCFELLFLSLLYWINFF